MIFSGIRSTDTGAAVLEIVGMIILAFLAIGFLCTILEPVYEKIKEWAEAKWGTRDSDVEDGDIF